MIWKHLCLVTLFSNKDYASYTELKTSFFSKLRFLILPVISIGAIQRHVYSQQQQQQQQQTKSPKSQKLEKINTTKLRKINKCHHTTRLLSHLTIITLIWDMVTNLLCYVLFLVVGCWLLPLLLPVVAVYIFPCHTTPCHGTKTYTNVDFFSWPALSHLPLWNCVSVRLWLVALWSFVGRLGISDWLMDWLTLGLTE